MKDRIQVNSLGIGLNGIGLSLGEGGSSGCTKSHIPPEHQDMMLHHHQRQLAMAVVRHESGEVLIE
ncbi:hypothetical protein ACLOJK_036524 [Asimina triloba]